MKYRKVLQNLFLIRKTEELISKEYHKNIFRCPVHLSIGQEAISAAINFVFNSKDLAVSSHRAHAHYIGKGGNIKNMFAEILGLKGCSGGIGGSMHLTDKSVGFISSSAIVGNSIPVGVGLSLSQKMENKKNLTLIFFGDGATEQGVFFESVNFSALKNLPTLFICEDNKYSVYSSLSVRQPENRDILKVVKKMGIEAIEADGNNIFQVIKTYQKAKKYIFSKKKPFFIKFNTYRYVEHCGPYNDDNLNYRPKKEIKRWKRKCPISFFSNYLVKKNLMKNKQIVALEKEIENYIHNLYKNSKNYPKPNFSTTKKLIYNEKSC